jgi:predicted GNAT family acetyltransferase
LLERAGEALEVHGAESNLVQGLCADLVRQPSASPWFLATVETNGAVIGAAIRSPGHPVVMTRLPGDAADALAAFVCEAVPDLTAATGPAETVTAFAVAWSHRTGRPVALQMSQRLYECRAVTRPRLVAGEFRAATAADQALLVDWVHDFHVAIGLPTGSGRVDELVAGRIAAGRFGIWDDGGPVSLAGFSRETGQGASINHVYTPPECRRRGYAGACVAALTQRLFDAGRRFCCLYTDLSNPTSNHVYQNVGYRPVCDAAMWRLGAG